MSRVELIGVFDPKRRPLSTLSDGEIDALADELHGQFVEKLDGEGVEFA